MNIGANYAGDGRCDFAVWAPLVKDVSLKIDGENDLVFPMQKDDLGYWNLAHGNIRPGAHYLYRLDGAIERPDPASFFQPDGVHGASQIIDHAAYAWDDLNWPGIELEKMIIYELHLGTFTFEGTFESAIAKLSELKYLGVNTIEILPVAQFPGKRNWGYDGAYLFAPQNSYGGPDGFKKLVDACHAEGMAVILDVVYNHLGPEGNYLADFAPYFTNRYNSPWSQAVNFDGPYSYGVRNFVIENALHWFRHYHLDGLRLDAIHSIFDFGAKHILEELAEQVEKFSAGGRKRYLIAESDLNDTRIIRSRELGGYGLDAQWSDDFHHAIHALLTGERGGYYADFGRPEQLVKALGDAFVYTWGYSEYRKRYHGSSTAQIPAGKFVVYDQNHDQVGNRMLGERLSRLVPFEALKLAAATVLISPYIPLLFMGEEHGETNPFLYFIDHGDPALRQAVRDGRKREFEAFGWSQEPPDPSSEETFLRCKINWDDHSRGKNKALFEFYREMIRLRSALPALTRLNKDDVKAWNYEKIIFFQRGSPEQRIFCIFNFGDNEAIIKIDELIGRWRKLLDSSDWRWWGPGSSAPEEFEVSQSFTVQPYSFLLYQLEA